MRRKQKRPSHPIMFRAHHTAQSTSNACFAQIQLNENEDTPKETFALFRWYHTSQESIKAVRGLDGRRFYTTNRKKKSETHGKEKLLYSASIAGFFLAVFQARIKKLQVEAKQKQSDAEARDDPARDHAVLGVFVVLPSLYS